MKRNEGIIDFLRNPLVGSALVCLLFLGLAFYAQVVFLTPRMAAENLRPDIEISEDHLLAALDSIPRLAFYYGSPCMPDSLSLFRRYGKAPVFPRIRAYGKVPILVPRSRPEEKSVWWFRIPRVIRQSENKPLSVGLIAGRRLGEKTVDSLDAVQVEVNLLCSEVLHPVPPSGPARKSFGGSREIRWDWILAPSEPGEYTLILAGLTGLLSSDLSYGLPPVQSYAESAESLLIVSLGEKGPSIAVKKGAETAEKEILPREAFRPTGKESLEFKIVVLTTLGLTARQSAVMKFLAILVGAIGALLGLPLWRKLFGRRRRVSTREPSKGRSGRAKRAAAG